MCLNKTHNLEWCVAHVDIRMDIKKTCVHKRLDSTLKMFLSVVDSLVNIIEGIYLSIYIYIDSKIIHMKPKNCEENGDDLDLGLVIISY